MKSRKSCDNEFLSKYSESVIVNQEILPNTYHYYSYITYL